MLRLTQTSDARQANFARLAAEVARHSIYHCAECGSVDGMERWEPWQLAALQFNELPVFFYLRGNGKALYASCPECCEEVPEQFVPAPLDEVAVVWDKARFDYVGMD